MFHRGNTATATVPNSSRPVAVEGLAYRSRSSKLLRKSWSFIRKAQYLVKTNKSVLSRAKTVFRFPLAMGKAKLTGNSSEANYSHLIPVKFICYG